MGTVGTSRISSIPLLQRVKRPASLTFGSIQTAIARTAIPHEKLYNHVDTPATIKYSQSGQAQVPLDPATGSIIKLHGYEKISIRIGTTKAKQVTVNMGKISGATLSQFFNLPVDQKIHTLNVVGPEMVLWLMGGPANTEEKVQLWVYLH